MTAAFTSVNIVGGLLPSELFGRILAGDKMLPGLAPETYGLQRGESVRRQAARSWDYLLGIWREFQERLGRTPESQWTELTRQRWLHILLRELDFRDAQAGPGIEIEGKPFPISHRHGCVPIHLLGWQTDLDHRTPGRIARAPQSMVQELLNRTDDFLWSVLSNGAKLRLLRDSRSLVGSAYVEFDLQAMFDGELFSDFVLLYRVCHESRLAPIDDGGPSSCFLEQWLSFASELGTRALEQLRSGVETAIAILGTGFLLHPSNPHLRHRLNGSSELRIEDFNRALLRVVYRLLFWFVAEDRDVLLDPDTPRAASQRYRDFFSSNRLRRIARKRQGTRHSDLWEATRLVFDALGVEGGVPNLGLPGIGGLYEPGPLDEPLDGARLTNRALLNAVRALSIVRDKESGGGMRPVDFGNLGAEELGSVYESMLEQIPRYNPDERTYTLEKMAGNDRKETGSYYTPTSLVDCLLDSTLDPLLDDAVKTDDPLAALLDITICDPACGSGHFLVAAARRLAKRVAAERSGDPEPSEAAVRAAMREVVGRCIYGVDINPMAAELAKVSLWMEAMEPGKPLAFLDTNIRVGNSLLGVTPKLLRDGIPDDAFKALEGDDKKVTAALKKDNKLQRSGQGDLFSLDEIPVRNTEVATATAGIVRTLPASLEDVHIQAKRARELLESNELRSQKLLADAWCAAFVQLKTEETRQSAITHSVLERLAADSGSAPATLQHRINELTRDYRFLHWHIEFPHIFPIPDDPGIDTDPQTGWSGGFTCVIGNPPWERVKLQEQEFFASRRPEIANAPNAAVRKRLIKQLTEGDEPASRELYTAFQIELRKAAGWSVLLRDSGRFTLTGHGDINTYAVFAETACKLIDARGRMGMVLPTGIATDATTAPFFSDVIRRSALVSFLDFENEAFLLSRDVDHRVRFCLLTVAGRSVPVKTASFAFSTRYMADLESRRFAMPPEEILLVNPNTGTCPIFRSRRDAEITLNIYRRLPILWRDSPEENLWELSFMRMFDMANDSGLFHTRKQLEGDGWTLDGNIFVKSNNQMLPLYEAKMIHHFDHRFGTYEGQTQAQANMGTLPRPTPEQKNDPGYVVLPRYWIAEERIAERLKGRWNKGWLLGWRDICRSTDERTMICSLFPRTAAPDSTLLMLPTQAGAGSLIANLGSIVFDYVVRQKSSGTHLKFFTVRQLPILSPMHYKESTPWISSKTLGEWITERVLELSYTAYDLREIAQELGEAGRPFRWNDERRALLRAEVDAVYFHLYGIEMDDVEYVMDAFKIVRERDEKRFGEYRTKRLILEVYDAMAEAIRTGKPYQTVLDPPPGQGPRHPPRDG
jgi:hypothetical protein